MADAQQPIGPLGALHSETIVLGGPVVIEPGKFKLVQFMQETIVKKYGESRMMVGISDIEVVCPQTVHCALIPDSWGKPKDDAFAEAMGFCPCPALTTLYTPTAKLEFAPFLTPQLKPKTLIGEPPALLLFSTQKVSCQIKFRLHLHGVGPIKWDAAHTAP